MSPLHDGQDTLIPLAPAPPVLTPRQQLVYEAAALAPLSAMAAGTILHTAANCAHCTDDTPCQYAEKNGREVLNALKRKGLVRRDRHHVYTRTDAVGERSSQLGADDPWPEGF